jgi:hypothetical protein
VWKSIRISLLLAVLAVVALHTWLDRVATQSWQEPLYLFADPGMAGSNSIVITHELLHAVGASVLIGPETAREIRWTR